MTQPPEQVAREIAEHHRSDYLHLGNMVADRKLQARIAAALTAARAEAIEEFCNNVLKGIEREQSYREFREDQDGSGIGACKEIAGWVRACRATALAKTGGEA